MSERVRTLIEKIFKEGCDFILDPMHLSVIICGKRYKLTPKEYSLFMQLIYGELERAKRSRR